MGQDSSTAIPDWVALDRAHVWHPYTQMLTAPPPLPVVAAQGAWLELADGRRLLDGISSWWVTLHGHRHPRLVEALCRQAERLEQVIFAGFCHEPASRLAAELSRRAPASLPRVFFSDDGSTAVEVALKLAVQYWRHMGKPRRTLFAALEGAYHGDTFGAMAAGGQDLFHGAFGPLLFEVVRLPVPRCEAEVEAALATFEHQLEKHGERLAALIVEPILQGAGGMRIHPPAYLRGLWERCRDSGVLFIADEVFTGFGRTGKLWACEHASVEPDLLCLSKGLTGGFLPLGVTLTSEPIFRAFLSEDRSRTFFHGHSFTANPLACAVALESLQLLEETRALERVKALERLFQARLERLKPQPAVGDVRGIGGVAVIELERSEAGYLDERGRHLAARLLEKGLLLRPLGSVVYFLPPYCVTDAECHWVFDLLEEELDHLAAAG
jgi:adenosylmethionine-8-amino-7-oxononanoate aminotransferase